MIKVTIRQAAKRRGLENAHQFGQSIGVKPMVAARIWNNGQPPKLKTLDKICNAWGCSLDELISHTLDRQNGRNGKAKAAKSKPSKRSSRSRA